MISKKQLLKNWKVYAVLDDGLFPDMRELLKKYDDLLESPIDVLQLRFRALARHCVFRMAGKMVRRAQKRNISVVINDRPEAALALGANGVHLGKGDIPAPVARKLLGTCAIIGRTIRGAWDLADIDRKDVDYAAIGPVFRTPLKPGLKAVPRREVRKVVKKAEVPLVAIGGINSSNVREIIGCGIKTVAFVRYGITEKDTRMKIDELRKIVTTEAE